MDSAPLPPSHAVVVAVDVLAIKNVSPRSDRLHRLIHANQSWRQDNCEGELCHLPPSLPRKQPACCLRGACQRRACPAAPLSAAQHPQDHHLLDEVSVSRVSTNRHGTAPQTIRTCHVCPPRSSTCRGQLRRCCASQRPVRSSWSQQQLIMYPASFVPRGHTRECRMVSCASLASPAVKCSFRNAPSIARIATHQNLQSPG